MPRWWDKLLGRKEAQATPRATPAKWLEATDPTNPFGVRLLDLMELQQVVSTTTDRETAARSVSWGLSVGRELDPGPLLDLPPLACSLRYPAAKSLPDGIVYAPPSMDFKWVLALREGRLVAARSWTGFVEAVVEVRREGDELVCERLRVSEQASLRFCANLVEVFDWLIRVHVWDQRLPLPVDDTAAQLLEKVPLSGFGPFGKALFCAAKHWAPPPPPRPMRSNGEVILAARKADLSALRQAAAKGADLDAPGTYGGYPALMVAILKKDAALFGELVKLGADPTVRGDRGLHALGLAVVQKAPVELLERIAATRLDFASPNDDGFTALHAAAEVDNAAAVPWLVTHGLPLEARTVHGHTPLHIACALGHAEVAKALLTAGAERTAASPGGTPRDVAVAEKKPALVAILDA